MKLRGAKAIAPTRSFGRLSRKPLRFAVETKLPPLLARPRQNRVRASIFPPQLAQILRLRSDFFAEPARAGKRRRVTAKNQW